MSKTTKKDKKPGAVNTDKLINVNAVNNGNNIINGIDTDILCQYVTIGNNGKRSINKAGYIPFVLKNADIFGVSDRVDIVKQWVDNPICAPVALKDVCAKIDTALNLGRGADGLNSIIQAIADICKPIGLSFSDQRGNNGIVNAIAAAAAQAAVQQQIDDAKQSAKDELNNGIRKAIIAMVDAGVEDSVVENAFRHHIDIVNDVINMRTAQMGQRMLQYLREAGIINAVQLDDVFTELENLRRLLNKPETMDN